MTDAFYGSLIAEMDSARWRVKIVAHLLTASGETDEAAMSALAVIDAIDKARKEIGSCPNLPTDTPGRASDRGVLRCYSGSF